MSPDLQPTERIDMSVDRPRSSRPRLASVVVKDLANHIISGDLPAGSTLPTEGVLGDQYGFSRTVMREALKLLEERGLVRVEQGRGTTVQPRTSWNLLDPDVLEIALANDQHTVLLSDLISVRRLLEAHMVQSAAEHLTDQDLDELAKNVEQMADSITDYPRFRALDLAFHAAIMRASQSEIGRAIVSTFHNYAGGDSRLSNPGSTAGLEHTVAEHRSVLSALRARDGELAARRMASHIDSAWAERRGGWQQPQAVLLPDSKRES